MRGKRKLSDKWKSMSKQERRKSVIDLLHKISPDGMCPSKKMYDDHKLEWMPGGHYIENHYANRRWGNMASVVGLPSRGKGNAVNNRRILKQQIQEENEQDAFDKVVNEVKNKRSLYGNGIMSKPSSEKRFYHWERRTWVTAIVSELL